MTRRTSDLQALGRVEGKLDMLLTNMTDLKADVCKRMDTQQTDIDNLKAWRNRSTGYLAAGATALAVLFETVRALIS